MNRTIDPGAAALPAARGTLEDLRHRPVRALLSRGAAHEQAAIWEVVYAGIGRVDHDKALAVAREMETTDRTVGELLNGWRPAALA